MLQLPSGVRSAAAGRRGLPRRHLGWDYPACELRGLKGAGRDPREQIFLQQLFLPLSTCALWTALGWPVGLVRLKRRMKRLKLPVFLSFG